MSREDLIRGIKNKVCKTIFWTCQLIPKYILQTITSSLQNSNKHRQTRFDFSGYISVHSKSKNLFTNLLSRIVSLKNMCPEENGVSSASHAAWESKQKMQHLGRCIS